jgi:hypothetical protein
MVFFISYFASHLNVELKNPAGYPISGLHRISGRISGIRLLDWPDIRQNQYPMRP